MDPAMKNLQQRLDKLETQKDAAYRERNKLVSLAARMAIALGHSAGLAMHDPTDAQWDPKWRTIVVIDLPTGLSREEHELRRQRSRLHAKAGEALCSYFLSREDHDLSELQWTLNSNGYLRRQAHLAQPTGYLHQIVAKRLFDKIPSGYTVDHVNRNPLDCSRSNIRLASDRAQALNKQHIGCSIRKRRNGRWSAMFGTPQVALGTFDKRKEALDTARNYYQERMLEAHRNGDFIYAPGTTSQVTWHIHDDEVGLFLFLPLYDKWKWDGHDTDEKYRRVQAAFPIDPATGRPK